MFEDEGKVSRELANVIGADKPYDMKGSEKLREFYKKLIQTDAQIKKLKQDFDNNNLINTEIDNDIKMKIPERYKRSLKFVRPKQHNVNRSRNKRNNRINNVNKSKRLKRADIVDQAEGYLIEKKKVLIQYKPFGSKRQFPKCFHTPKDSKFHEKHLKHPFYQNSQRLDELLDHILDRNLPEIIRDPLTLDLLFSNKGKCNHKSENKSYNFDSYTNVPNSFEGFTKGKEAKEETSTYRTTNQNNHDNYKADLTFIEFPTINSYIRNITLFDQAIENNHNYENLYNLAKTEPSPTQNTEFTDPSSNFMAKIHSNNNYETSSKSHFGSIVNKNKVLDNVSPTLNYANQKKLFDQNLDHKILSNKIEPDKNVLLDKHNNLNIKDLPQDPLIEMVIDDTKTEKTFDMNLDYSDILLPSTPKMNRAHTIFLINQEKQQAMNIGQYMNDWRSKSQSIRKLLQIQEEDDDTLGYEDLKEVLADEMEAHDETDRRVDRKKRNKNLPDVYNPNWKGPIPLYPDEINAIIKQAAIENVKVPVGTKEIIGIDKTSNQISDTDYIEDYFDNKYDRLVKIAQAYSDYGVFGSKKECVNQNKDKTVAEKLVNRNRLDISKSFNNNLNARFKKGTSSSEGIRFEFKPTKSDNVVKEPDILGSIQKHFRILKGNKSPRPKTTGNPFMHPDFGSIPNLSTLNYPLDKTHRLMSKTVEDLISIPKRSLKSIEHIEVDSYENGNVTLAILNNTGKDKKNDFFSNGEESEISQSIVSMKDKFKNDKNRDIIVNTKVNNFFDMMSDWFHVMAKMSDETSVGGSENSNLSTTARGNKSQEVSYPLYDSDMIENIGHRSRVILSIEDKNASLTTVNLKTKEEDKNHNKTDSSTMTMKQKNKNVTAAVQKDNEIQSLKDNKTNIKNKTISKRSLQRDSKLNFWNDIYDDEYGVKLDYSDKSARSKHSVRGGDIVKKSKNWIERKVKTIANILRSTKSTKEGAVTENTSSESIAVKKTSRYKRNISNRQKRNLFNDDREDTNDFGALTANMKKVVREATNAVKETRKLKAREDNKEENVASSLMQQLVRLMTDVVDFQVQQKTCSKLPPDLLKFLEWLTSPSNEKAPLEDITTLGPGYGTNNAYNRYEKSVDDTVDLALPETRLDDRTQCLRSIEAIQELMKQYDEMNDEDKSKMIGVKEYLDNQLNFLTRKTSAMNEFNIYKYHKKRETPNRFYRDWKKMGNDKIDRRIKRGMNKFIKNYERKHTRTTIGNFDAVTEGKEMKKSR